MSGVSGTVDEGSFATFYHSGVELLLERSIHYETKGCGPVLVVWERLPRPVSRHRKGGAAKRTPSNGFSEVGRMRALHNTE